jgi:hypothetical protein
MERVASLSRDTLFKPLQINNLAIGGLFFRDVFRLSAELTTNASFSLTLPRQAGLPCSAG